MNQLDILAEGPFAMDHMAVTWAGPAPEPVGAAGDYLEARWRDYRQQAAARGSHLYDAPVAHLMGFEVDGAGLRLVLAPTTYRRFLVTVLRDREWFERHAPSVMTPALGNSIFLTRGSQALLGVRSEKVAAYPGRSHLIGGVLDWPNEPRGASWILEHLYKELWEELGVVADELVSPPRIVGLYRDHLLAQPELVWHGELTTPLGEVLQRHEDEEHAALRLLELDSPEPGHDATLTPVAALALERWRGGGWGR